MSSGPQKFRQTEASRLVRAAKAAGLPIKRMTLAPDGTIAIETEAGSEPSVPPNPWEEKDAS